MKKIYKSILTSCALFLSSINVYVYTQTNLGISIGMDYSKVTEIPNSVGFQILDSGFKSKSIYGSLRIEQRVTKSTFLSLSGSFTKKKLDATDKGFVPFKRLEYNDIGTSLSYNWIPLSTINIGGGINHSFIPSINKIRKDDSKEEITGKRREIGGFLSIGYMYKYLLFEVSYYNGFDVVGTTRKSNRIEPIRSIKISFSYLLRLFEVKKSKQRSHPRI